MSNDRGRLNDALRGMGYDVRGDLVVVRPAQSETREVRSPEKAVVAEMTTEVGDAFSADGIRLERFRRNPVALWAHDYEGLPVARSLWERVRGGEDAADMFIVKLQFHLDTQLSREVWALVKDDVKVNWELGVVPAEWEFGTAEQVLVTKWDLVEVSAAPSGACVAEIRRRISNRRINSPAMLRSVGGAEPECKEPEITVDAIPCPLDVKGPYWHRKEYAGHVIHGPGFSRAVETNRDAAARVAELNDAWRRGRESAAEEPPDTAEPDIQARVAELEKWRVRLDERFARVREQWNRDAVADRRWGDGPEEEAAG